MDIRECLVVIFENGLKKRKKNKKNKNKNKENPLCLVLNFKIFVMKIQKILKTLNLKYKNNFQKTTNSIFYVLKIKNQMGMSVYCF